VVVRDCRRRGEVALAEFYCSLEEGVLGRTAPAVFGFPQRGEFPREQTVWFLLPCYSKYTKHLRKPVFFWLRRYSINADHHVGVLLCGGNHTPRGNPGLKCTRMDDILKKIRV
jgi:hypothetical protein